MFEKITPEQAGISSERVIEFIQKLEKRGSSTHGVLFMKGDKIFTEAYWKPFHKDFCHRQYSQTKSFVGVAIGLLLEEGKLTLDDKIVDYFPDKVDGEWQKYFTEQTIREMLTMTTVGGSYSWFISGDPDRVHHYFNEPRNTHPSGTLWEYDSPGSQVLCALVEKLSGKPLLEYLKEKLFNKMNAFQTARILKTPNGDSWGDSAMVCPLRDMAAFGRLVMNYGEWNGERLISEDYLREATSKVVSNVESAHYSACEEGYGYQIWRVIGNGFAFVGLGDQLTVCFPEKDFLFACTADNQGSAFVRRMIFQNLEELFVEQMQDEPLPENPSAQKRLDELLSNLELRSVKGLADSAFRQELNGAEYLCEENPMGITKFSFVFNDEKTGELHYTNAQGDKVLPFGVNHNVFGKFPQLGYSDEVGATPTTDGFMYDDAVSFAWLEEKKLLLFVQIIDKYFGNMSALFAFKGDEAHANFTKTAEAFLDEYEGKLVAKKKS
ncbi:MAG: serine hydrolase [Clostridia bacterium]|nr:serine hydrolase [Clostridia bacterium]MBQ8657974.1 serine hydrolase [Clostridia bacterium]